MFSRVAMLGSELDRTMGRRTGVGDASLSSYMLCDLISASLSGDDA